MNATEKYLFETRMAFLADDTPPSDADIDAMLGASGPAADPAKRNPNPLTAAGLADMLGAIIERSNRRLEVVAEVFGLDLERLLQTAEEAEQDGAVDRMTANMVALEREFSRHGPTVRPLTKWILTNAGQIVVMPVDSFGTDATAKIKTYGDGGGMKKDAPCDASDMRKTLVAQQKLAEREGISTWDSNNMRKDRTIRGTGELAIG